MLKTRAQPYNQSSPFSVHKAFFTGLANTQEILICSGLLCVRLIWLIPGADGYLQRTLERGENRFLFLHCGVEFGSSKERTRSRSSDFTWRIFSNISNTIFIQFWNNLVCGEIFISLTDYFNVPFLRGVRVK